MEQVAFIVWRESIEALLVVGILFTWLRASPEGRRGLPWLWSGVAAGLLLAGALGLALLSFWLLQLGGRFITWRRFFRITETLLLLLAGALLVLATDRLISLEVLPTLIDPVWDSA